jgi:hypothetical protein
MRRRGAAPATAIAAVVALLLAGLPSTGLVGAVSIHPALYSGPSVVTNGSAVNNENSTYKYNATAPGQGLIATAWASFFVGNTSHYNGTCAWFLNSTPIFNNTSGLTWHTVNCFTFSGISTNLSSGHAPHLLFFTAVSSAVPAAGTYYLEPYIVAKPAASLTDGIMDTVTVLLCNETVNLAVTGQGIVSTANTTGLAGNGTPDTFGANITPVNNSLIVSLGDIYAFPDVSGGHFTNVTGAPYARFLPGPVGGWINNSGAGLFFFANPGVPSWPGVNYWWANNSSEETAYWGPYNQYFNHVAVHMAAIDMDFIPGQSVGFRVSSPELGGILLLVLVAFFGGTVMYSLASRKRRR